MITPPMPPISKTGNDRFSKILFWAGILIIPTILIIQVLVYQPFFGVYHDWDYIKNSGSLQQFVSYQWNFVSDQYGYLGADQFPRLVFFPYFFITHHTLDPTTYYLLNTLTALAALGLVAWSFRLAKLLTTRNAVACFLAMLLFPYTYDLFAFPILSEKGVLFAIGFLTLLAVAVSRQESLLLSIWLSLFAGLLLFFTGRSLLLFVPFFVYVSFPASKIRKTTPAILFSGTLLATSGFILISAVSSSYIVGMRSSNILQNLAQAEPIFFVIMSGISLAILLIRENSPEERKSMLASMVLNVSLIVALIFFGSINQWLAVFSAGFGLWIGSLFSLLRRQRTLDLAIASLVALTTLWIVFRGPQLFQPLHGIGEFAQSSIARQLGSTDSRVEVWCAFGAGYLKEYIRMQGYPSPNFVWNPGESEKVDFVLADESLCPPPRDLSAWRVVWASSGRYGFQLFQNEP